LKLFLKNRQKKDAGVLSPKIYSIFAFSGWNSLNTEFVHF